MGIKGAYVLGVETAAGSGDLALLQGGALLARCGLGEGGARTAGLVPAASALLAGSGLAPADLALVAVDAGPGSFTGTRAGVAFAKALGYAAGCALAAVSSLEARAREAADAGVRGLLAVALDARRGRFYAAAFRAEGDSVTRLIEDALYDREGLHAAVPAGAAWLGDAAGVLARAGETPLPGAGRAPAAETVARLGAVAPRLTPFSLAPSYLRLVEAQERRMRRAP